MLTQSRNGRFRDVSSHGVTKNYFRMGQFHVFWICCFYPGKSGSRGFMTFVSQCLQMFSIHSLYRVILVGCFRLQWQMPTLSLNVPSMLRLSLISSRVLWAVLKYHKVLEPKEKFPLVQLWLQTGSKEEFYNLFPGFYGDFLYPSVLASQGTASALKGHRKGRSGILTGFSRIPDASLVNIPWISALSCTSPKTHPKQLLCGGSPGTCIPYEGQTIWGP